ncbi:MAG TPA: 4Fe-4S binding protein, partial [Thermoplasmata archaeon]|nr:4Fe-4S binding protein [Thermoplasmata archaeon]
DMGFRVLLVEKQPSVGGKMILLSKVFPSLDCASCISTPKMAAAAHHPNITLLTYAEVQGVAKGGEGDFEATIVEKPRYVDASLCTSCGQCADACPVLVPKEFDYDLIGRKAAYIPFDTAVPKTAVIDLENCILCGQCERACPAHAVNFLQVPRVHHVRVASVVLATGFRLFEAERKKEYRFGENPNVVTAMQMERLLGPTRPYHCVLRPSDGKEPGNIAYVLCTGSRDHTVGNPQCSRVCCMFSIKQAQLILGALPMADVTIYYMDIRAYGKGFEEFYQQARSMGVKFVRGKIAKITPAAHGDVTLWYEDTEAGGGVRQATHDLAVLAVGLLPNPEAGHILTGEELELGEGGWVQSADENCHPTRTSVGGVFVAGTASGPKDIPDSIVDAAAAASECAGYLIHMRREKAGCGSVVTCPA